MDDALTRCMGRDRYAELTGLEVVRALPGDVEIRLPVTEKILNGHGNVHGGALFTLADYASAAASNMFGVPTVATGASISYLRAATRGHLVAKAKTVKNGKRMKFQAVEIFDADGELVALFQGASIVVGRKNGGASAPA